LISVIVEVLLISKLVIQKIRELPDGIGIVFELELMDHLLLNVKRLIDLSLEDVNLLHLKTLKNMVTTYELQKLQVVINEI
jgi:hypothetical protein